MFIHTDRHPFNGLFYRTTWETRHQKGSNEATDGRVAAASAGPYANYLLIAACTQVTTPAPHRSRLTGQILFLMLNQQCQSTDGIIIVSAMSIIIMVRANDTGTTGLKVSQNHNSGGSTQHVPPSSCFLTLCTHGRIWGVQNVNRRRRPHKLRGPIFPQCSAGHPQKGIAKRQKTKRKEVRARVQDPHLYRTETHARVNPELCGGTSTCWLPASSELLWSSNRRLV